jgi:cation:H+ antiporter
MEYFLLILGMAILIYSADLLVKGASSFAKMMKVSNLMIGLTVVAFGTSFPELIVNIFASSTGNSDLAVGNVVGSNLVNILLILGISAVVKPLLVQNTTVRYEIPFGVLATLVLFVVANDTLLSNTGFNVINRTDGLIFLSFFIIFIYYTFVIGTSGSVNNEDGNYVAEMSKLKSTLLIIAGFVGLYFGGKFIVESATTIAEALGMSQYLIGVLVVGVGTSLPELATSVVASLKGNSDMAVGNIVGSNIFNIFFILGISAVMTDIPFNPSINLDILLGLIATILLFVFVFTGKGRKIDRVEGSIFVVAYLAYVVYILL